MEQKRLTEPGALWIGADRDMVGSIEARTLFDVHSGDTPLVILQ